MDVSDDLRDEFLRDTTFKLYMIYDGEVYNAAPSSEFECVEWFPAYVIPPFF